MDQTMEFDEIKKSIESLNPTDEKWEFEVAERWAKEHGYYKGEFANNYLNSYTCSERFYGLPLPAIIVYRVGSVSSDECHYEVYKRK